MPKDQQRGFMQPYIVTMQVCALALMISRNGVPTKALVDLTISLPALAAGTALGLVMFGRINDALFRNVVLVVLLAAGVLLVV